jgi:hypothetical protein
MTCPVCSDLTPTEQVAALVSALLVERLIVSQLRGHIERLQEECTRLAEECVRLTTEKKPC